MKNEQEQKCRILAQGREISSNTRKTGLNNNDLLIGPSGAGKTRGYVIPNILQCQESMLITDTKGSLYGQLGKVLEQEGYDVLNIDFTDCFSSPCGYNPLDQIRYDGKRGRFIEQDILTVAACLIPSVRADDPFWELAARMFLECLVSYVLECLPEEEQTLDSAVKLFIEMDTGIFSRLIAELKELDPDSFAVWRYQMFRATMTAEKMYCSILGILSQKLSAMAFDGAKALFHAARKVDFPSLGRKKTAVFLNVSDTDRSMDGLVNLFYTQALHALCGSADKSPGHRLKVPVRFYLDDFAANVRIPDFDKIISVIRSREISVSIILQSLSQLEGLYGRAEAATILNNCDNILYLGGQDEGTAEYISTRTDKPIQEILNMPLDMSCLLTRGRAPETVKRFDLKQHEKYGLLPEAEYGC